MSCDELFRGLTAGAFAGIDVVRNPLVPPGSVCFPPAPFPVMLHPRDYFVLVVELADIDERTRINAHERLRYLERRAAARGEGMRYPTTVEEAWL